MDGGDSPGQGTVTCGTWIRRPENKHLVVVGKTTPSSLEIFSFDPETTSLSASPKAKYEFEEGVNPVTISVHPNGEELVCLTSSGDCKLFELSAKEDKIKLTAKEQIPLQGIGLQKCLAFSVDGTRFSTGGADGCLRIFEWPSMRIILDERRAHKSFQDMDFRQLSHNPKILKDKEDFIEALLTVRTHNRTVIERLDSEFLASTSTDGSARIWNTSDGTPITTLTRNSDEKIELCRFSKDGTKPFLFCSVQRGDKPLTVVWDISTWKKVGHKRLLRKPASIMSISLDGKYLALGTKDGDICVVEVNNMEVRHRSKRLHLGSDIESLAFCPTERVVLTTSKEWGAMVTKLTVPAEWKEWQLYLLLLGMFLASLVAFYIFFENSDSFWNFPLPNNQAARPIIEPFLGDPQSDQNIWEHVDL